MYTAYLVVLQHGDGKTLTTQGESKVNLHSEILKTLWVGNTP